MALKLKIKRRDVIRIGDILVGIDIESPHLIVIIDAPRSEKITHLRNEANEVVTAVMAKAKTGMRLRVDGSDVECDDAAS